MYEIKDGKKHGLFKKPIIQNGNIRSERVYVEGRLEGESKVYSIEGVIIETVGYLHNKKHGISKLYFSNGNIKSRNCFPG